MKNSLLITAVIFLLSTTACAQIPKDEDQIQAALMAAPEESRSGATIKGYNSSGEVVILREGSNDLVCLSDDPARNGFAVSCYQKDLDPYINRGRVLRAEGKSDSEVGEIRAEEVESGSLSWPEGTASMFILTGEEGTFDPANRTVENQYLRYVLYVPYATPESTGLPMEPIAPGAPWIMDGGTYHAHIMIVPPRDG